MAQWLQKKAGDVCFEVIRDIHAMDSTLSVFRLGVGYSVPETSRV